MTTGVVMVNMVEAILMNKPFHVRLHYHLLIGCYSETFKK